MSGECIFCKMASKELSAELVHEDDDVVAFRDINPQAPTHILVIPKKHITSLNDLGAQDDALMGHLVRTGEELAKKEGHGEKGYRLVFNCGEDAGYSVFHIHLHVLGGRAMSWPPG
jgi:histidine triad (HIT) family protein